jgi:hypothetical protein
MMVSKKRAKDCAFGKNFEKGLIFGLFAMAAYPICGRT